MKIGKRDQVFLQLKMNQNHQSNHNEVILT